MKEYVYSLIVHDRPGVMQRISMIFARRMINIDTINVGSLEFRVGKFSRIVMTTRVDEHKAWILKRLLEKIIDVVNVDMYELKSEEIIERELALIHLRLNGDNEEKMLRFSRMHNLTPHIIDLDLAHSLMAIEVTGLPWEIQGLIDDLGSRAVVRAVRTGVAAIPKLKEVLWVHMDVRNNG